MNLSEIEVDLNRLDNLTLVKSELNNSYILFNNECPTWASVNLATALVIINLKKYKSMEKTIDFITKLKIENAQEKLSKIIEFLKLRGFLESEKKIMMKRKIAKENRVHIYTVYLNVTSKCNLMCSYCCMDANGGEIIEETKDLAYNEIIKIIDKIHEYDSNIDFVLLGGEPTLNNKLIDIIHYLDLRNIETSIVTNGILLNDDFVSRLPKNINIKVSIDSFDGEINDSLRGGTSKVIEGIDKLVEYGFKPKIGVTLSKENMSDIDNILNECKESELPVSFAMLEPFGRGNLLDDMILSNHELIESFETIERFHNSYKTSRENLNFCKHINYEQNSINHYCGLGKNVISIASNGDVFACINLHVDEYRMGNVLHEKFEDIISEKQLDKLLIAGEDIDECKSCEYKYLCAGGCRAKNYWSKKNTAIDSNICEALKYFIKRDIEYQTS